MKKILFCFLSSALATACATGGKPLTPDMSLLTPWEKAEKISEKHKQPPYIAVFKKDEKTLIYLASKHNSGKTLDMVDYVFANFKPQIAVLEYENSGRALRDKCSWNEFEYSAGIASDKNLPVALADLQTSDKLRILAQTDPDVYKTYQARWSVVNATAYEKASGKKTTAAKEIVNFKTFIWNEQMPRPMDAQELKNWFEEHFAIDFDKANLNEVLKDGWNYPLSTGTVFNKLSNDEDMLVRDPFMLRNITAALNKYDTVYAAFGEGHYRSHRKVLEKMLGKPEYIWELKTYTDRNHYQGFRIKQEVLVPTP